MSTSDDEEHIGPYSQKKRRIPRACDSCRERKKRCSGPQRSDNKCSRCIDWVLECTYEYIPKKRGRPKGYTEGLEQRVQTLEGLLKKMCPNKSVFQGLLSSENPKEPAISSAEIFTPASSPSSSSFPSIFPQIKSEDDEPWTEMLRRVSAVNLGSQDDPFRDDDADYIDLSERLKSLSIQPEDNRFWGKSSGAMLMQTAMSLKNEYAKNAPIKRIGQSRRPLYWKKLDWQIDIIYYPPPSYTFPPPDLITQLVDTYFEHVNLFYPLLHRPTFDRDVANGLHLRDDGFGGILMLVCAVGSRYMGKIDERTLLDGIGLQLSAGWKWYNQVQVVKQRLMEPPTLYDLQSYCLAVQFLQGCYAPHSAWILLGFGIRLAQDVGIHRKRIPVEQLTVQDELWKRVFWVLLALDRTISLAMGRANAIFDDDFDLDMPIECDDEYWEHQDARRCFKQPEGVPCTVTAFNHQLRLHKIMSFGVMTIYSVKTKYWKFLSKKWEQDVVAQLDSALNHWTNRLPDYLRWDPHRTDDRFFKLSGFLMTSYYYIQILIHRPYIRIKEPSSKDAIPSLTICTSAARSCSSVLEQLMKRMATVDPHMHLPSVTAAIVLLMNAWGAKRGGVSTNSSEMKHVSVIMDILKKAEDRWQSAGTFFDILNELAGSEEFISPEENVQATFHDRPLEPCPTLALTESISVSTSFPPTGKLPLSPNLQGAQESVYSWVEQPPSGGGINDLFHLDSQSCPIPELPGNRIKGLPLDGSYPILTYHSAEDSPDISGSSFENNYIRDNSLRTATPNYVQTNVESGNSTMDVLLNTPAGLDFNEWNNFLNSLVGVTGESGNHSYHNPQLGSSSELSTS